MDSNIDNREDNSNVMYPTHYFYVSYCETKLYVTTAVRQEKKLQEILNFWKSPFLAQKTLSRTLEIILKVAMIG